MYLIPDLTGENELYKVSNDQSMIFKTDQVISFDSPIFAASLQVTALGTVNKTLVYGADWSYAADNIDVEATSAMKLLDSSFTAVLLKSIVIINPYVGAEYKVNCAYQKLYPVTGKIALLETGEPLQVTPDLIKDMLDMIRRHDLLLSPIKSVTAVTDNNCQLLELDPHKERPENFISGETHAINVPENVEVIHPLGGAFFLDSLVVKNVTTGLPLVKDTDYRVIGIDLYKTKISSNTSGVYRFIMITASIVGNVSIDYHAYGGDPTLEDIRALEDANVNLTQYIIDSQLLTANTVADAPAITLIRNKITELEETMRRLATTGRPTYGDVSSGGTLSKRITAVDTEFHWWTIASLFKVDGSDDVFVSDTMKLRVQTFYTKFSFDLLVNVNLLHPTDKLDVKILSATYPKGFVPFEDYSDIDNVIRPQVRVIWNDNVAQNSGAFLQIGMRLKTVAEETVVVEDWSGAESAWKLISDPATSVLPEDNTLTLPSTTHIWDTLNPDSKQATYLLPFEDGHLIWAGTEAMNRPSAGWKSIPLIHLMEPEIDIKNIRRMRLDLEELGGSRFPIMMDFIPGSENLVANASFTYNGKPAYVTGQIYRNPVTNLVSLTINCEITSGLASTELDIRQVVIFL